MNIDCFYVYNICIVYYVLFTILMFLYICIIFPSNFFSLIYQLYHYFYDEQVGKFAFQACQPSRHRRAPFLEVILASGAWRGPVSWGPFYAFRCTGERMFFSLCGTVRFYCAAYPSSRALQLPESSAAGSDVIHCLFGPFLTKGRRDHLIRERWFGQIISLQPCCRMDDGRLLIFTFHTLKLSK